MTLRTQLPLVLLEAVFKHDLYMSNHAAYRHLLNRLNVFNAMDLIKVLEISAIFTLVVTHWIVFSTDNISYKKNLVY